MFLVLGICYMTLQCIGWLLISEPNEEEKKMLEEESKPLQTEQETLMESPAATITKNRTSVKAVITYAAIAQYCCVASLLSR